MSSSELKQQIKELALNNDLDYARVAPVSRFKNAPEGHKPTDFLPEAESVISMGIKYSLGVQLSHRIGMANRRFRHVAFSYRWFGYGQLNMYFMDRAAYLVTRLLEKNGFVGVPIVASGVESMRDLVGPFSNRHAAVAAGNGEFGLNGLCVTPEAGPRARWVSVITNAKLEPDTMFQGPKICDVDKCRELGDGVPICVKVCPMHAFDLDVTQRLVMDGREFTYAGLNKFRCVAMGSQFNKQSLGLKNIRLPKNIDANVIRYIDQRLHPQQKMEAQFYYRRSHGCGLCLLLCPIASSAALDEAVKKVPKPSTERK
jgi:epoxyqueuosine reductase